jgi:hypothetical protein
VGTSKTTVSPDGTTATFEFVESRYSNGESVTGKGTMVRVGKNKQLASAHVVKGSWRVSKMESTIVTDSASGDSELLIASKQ